MSKVNVLVFPAGEVNSVELHDALSHNVNVTVFGCSSVDRHGGYVFKNYRTDLPNISSTDFIDSFNRIIDEWDIQYVFPTHDSVALFLSEHQKDINAKVIVATFETASVCRNKALTYNLFKKYSFCPKIYSSFIEFPVFVKPIDGQGAKNTKLINSKKDIPDNFNYDDNVICEYLPGPELTVDCLTDAKGTLVACLPRMRNRLMAGVCVSGTTMKPSEEIMNIANCINAELHFLGLWYFQIKQDAYGKYKLLEISTRCAGTMCLSRARGVNLPLLSLYAAQGKKLTVFENDYCVQMDRTLISRYKIDYTFSTVYIDYDDTLVEDDKVCIPVISFLYQCKNKGIDIFLLTKHEEDHDDSIEESLSKHLISQKLFDEIIKLRFDEKKADKISKPHSIFIDNAYSERKEVHDLKSIPVFDVEGIEVLLDWRV